jgi:hypothetical protein
MVRLLNCFEGVLDNLEADWVCSAHLQISPDDFLIVFRRFASLKR